MEQRGRSSADTDNVTALVQRPDPPEKISDEPDVVAIWIETVEAHPADWFLVGTHNMLINYCRAVAGGDLVAKVRAHRLKDPDNVDLDELETLDKMAQRWIPGIKTGATSLRITNQSKYDPAAAGRAGRNGGAKKPWET